MKFHNTLGRKTEEFKPISEEVKLYSCGPTVYSYYHIGNLRNAVFNDTLRRALEANDYKVKHVMNITDVGHLDSDADEGEDKLEAGAKRENKSVWEVADFYIDAFKHDMARLNILPPNGYKGSAGPYAKATDFIDQQIEIVKILVDKGYGYKTDQAVYFDISKLSSYGELSGQKLSDKEVAARPEVVKDSHKRNPQDFGLWFFAVGRFANHKMRWSSPWGEGFPGWHLECSAIIHTTLGEPIDIHTGGVDHIGTHHPNEIAQTEAAFGVKLANYWLHNEHLHVDGQKMSKSLGNLITLKNVEDRGYHTLALRLLYLQAHYRSQMNFTWESLDAAQKALNNIYSWADLQFQNLESKDLKVNYPLAYGKITEVMTNDLATPEALGWFSGMVNRVDELGIDSESVRIYAGMIDRYFGLELSSRKDISATQKQLIKQREQARQSQSWAKADEIRGQLAAQGIDVRDTEQGPVWARL